MLMYIMCRSEITAENFHSLDMHTYFFTSVGVYKWTSGKVNGPLDVLLKLIIKWRHSYLSRAVAADLPCPGSTDRFNLSVI